MQRSDRFRGIPDDDKGPDDLIQELPDRHTLKYRLDMEKAVRSKAPDVYKGETLEECRTFIIQMEAIFRAQPLTYNTHRIRVSNAASYLRGTPLKRWTTAEKTNPLRYLHWEKFKAFLYRILTNPELREQSAFEELQKVKQRKGERIGEMYNRMLAIEDDCDERSETDRIRTLDAALQDREVKKMMATQLRRRFRTADQWVERAEYYENIVRNLGPDHDKKDKDPIPEKKDSSHSNRSERRQRKENYRKGSGTPQGSNSQSNNNNSQGPRTRLDVKDMKCSYCNQPGHLKGFRNCPKFDDWKQRNPEEYRQKLERENARARTQVNAVQKDNKGKSEETQQSSTKASGKDKAKP
jgi:hypothetical protein